MRIMGLRPYVFITSWYATAIAQFLARVRARVREPYPYPYPYPYP